jgi:hypothetical protein
MVETADHSRVETFLDLEKGLLICFPQETTPQPRSSYSIESCFRFQLAKLATKLLSRPCHGSQLRNNTEFLALWTIIDHIFQVASSLAVPASSTEYTSRTAKSPPRVPAVVILAGK